MLRNDVWIGCWDSLNNDLKRHVELISLCVVSHKKSGSPIQEKRVKSSIIISISIIIIIIAQCVYSETVTQHASGLSPHTQAAASLEKDAEICLLLLRFIKGLLLKVKFCESWQTWTIISPSGPQPCLTHMSPSISGAAPAEDLRATVNIKSSPHRVPQPLIHQSMDSVRELVPFAKELLRDGSSRGCLKIYLLGSTFAVLGMVSGVVQAASSFFPEQEDPDLKMLKVCEFLPVKEEVPEPQTSLSEEGEELEDEEMDAVMAAKAKEMPSGRQRRMSFRAHAS
ncbi:hypothetical protein DNTS_026206 [Danionella cerebrum]|uniref:G0/G1 switch protein 2 n=1 Tax=Danionella cerebrum TaxID=2873325 RepID=A0A553R0G6_9TELE|nr:hypothetical protein DNTS_026206 [Danionella translucida]